MVDYIADYLENIRDRRVFPEVCYHDVHDDHDDYNDLDVYDDHDN